jgi:hypothetical protein
MAIVAAVFLFIIGVGLLSLGFNRRMYSIRSNHQITARCAADYGLTKAVYEMNLRLPAVDNSNLPAENGVPISGGDATYSYTVTNNSGTYSIQSDGRSGSQTKTILCDLRLKGLFEYAILTKNTLDIGSVSTVDCIGCDTLPLKIGTTNNPEAQIILKPNSVINGDILLGQGSNPSVIVGSGAIITGDIYAVATDFDLPTPEVPTDLTSAPNLAIPPHTINTPGKYQCPKIDLGNGGTLNVNADVEIWVRGDITLKNDANIIVAPNAKLTIYLGGTLDGLYGSGFNNGGEPNKLNIIGLSSGKIEIKNNGDFCGTIYAPYADVLMHNSTEIYGSVIANNYTQDNSAIFSYDARLRQVSIEDAFVRFVPTHWREQ